MTRVHKEGYVILAIVLTLLAAAVVACVVFWHDRLWISVPLFIVFCLLAIFVARFFRVPARKTVFSEDKFYSPADGTIVVIENTFENEFLKEERIQVSIFMSVWDVHLNFFPLNGKIIYRKHHQGKYLIARHPKSSVLNERVSVVIEDNKSNRYLLRQIAGIVARRIRNYAQPERLCITGQEMGFIKFGSRVDIFFPVGTVILVKMGQHVTGAVTEIANI